MDIPLIEEIGVWLHILEYISSKEALDMDCEIEKESYNFSHIDKKSKKKMFFF